LSISRRVVLGGAALLSLPLGARAQTREETLRVVSGSTINTLDPTLVGATPQSIAFALNFYDRLVTFARKKTADGHLVFDLSQPRGELAESFTVSPDGLTITFTLRQGATFHDGSPVTVQDVKWSMDRAVLAKSGAAPQLSTGSLTKPEQFKIVDDHTFQVTLDKPDRLALGNLATPFARIINSTLAKQHATADDPWANDWLKSNDAGGGATIPGKTARAASCPTSSASSCRWCPKRGRARASSSGATPTSRSTCRSAT
jgi:peptide/nickel transport system substrate-binding protein